MRRSLAFTDKHSRVSTVLCCRGSAMPLTVDEIIERLRAEALVRGDDWLRETVTQILKNAGMAPDAQDPPPRARRVRPSEHRSPSPVPRSRRRVRSPSRDPPGSAAGQCPASEMLRPGRNPLTLDLDLRYNAHSVRYDDEDLRISFDATSRRRADSGPSTAVAVNASLEGHRFRNDHLGQRCFSPLADSQPELKPSGGQSQRTDSSSYRRVPVPARTAEESDSIRIRRLLQECSAAVRSAQQHATSAPVPVSLPAPDLQPCLVWILGNSFVTSALERVSLLPDGSQLGFPRSKVVIRWLGMKSLRWVCLKPTVVRYLRVDRPPDILIVHAGGDDLGIIPLRVLSKDIKFDMLRMKDLFPGAIVVWSEIVNRPKWPVAKSQKGLEHARIKVNKEVSKNLASNGAVVIRHRKLEGDSAHLFEEDGVHLNSTGNDIWCIDIQEGIDEALQLWQHGVTTRRSL
ncbi:uncharacterized protein LOC142659255 [Rhinoderma darwinii]|uniref:uncharacterized protein LOC142659255 n=1 Tax=Rhinoderma darwinii TaxID=43563 RepID=UPI003F67C336